METEIDKIYRLEYADYYLLYTDNIKKLFINDITINDNNTIDLDEYQNNKFSSLIFNLNINNKYSNSEININFNNKDIQYALLLKNNNKWIIEKNKSEYKVNLSKNSDILLVIVSFNDKLDNNDLISIKNN